GGGRGGGGWPWGGAGRGGGRGPFWGGSRPGPPRGGRGLSASPPVPSLPLHPAATARPSSTTASRRSQRAVRFEKGCPGFGVLAVILTRLRGRLHKRRTLIPHVYCFLPGDNRPRQKPESGRPGPPPGWVGSRWGGSDGGIT